MVIKTLSFVRRYSSEVKSAKFFTTPIYYVNANPHIGHLYSSLIADAARRWERVSRGGGGGGETPAALFSTGSDEHGSKIQQAAAKEAVDPRAYCDRISSRFRKLADDFHVGYTDFVRTTDEAHKETVRRFWKKISDNNHIYKSSYQGYYCVPDETFLATSQLKEVQGADGGSPKLVSAESGHPVEWTSEENYMFRLTSFRDDLIHWLNTNEDVVRPRKFHKFLVDLLQRQDEQEEGGLQDLSVSRPASRVRWGIPVPGDSQQTVYVWMDALVNYLTAAGYGADEGRFRRCWPPDLQVIGKDILKFHGIYWPAFLMAADLEPPRSILCHSHWTVDGEKMSKSKGNVVCPFDRSATYTTDGMRYFLLREGVAHSDGNYSDIKATRILNSELADTFGNLLSRCCSKSLNPSQKFPKFEKAAFEAVYSLDVTKKLIDNVSALPNQCRCHYEDLHFHKVADSVVATLHSANLFFETLKPWELKKNPGTHQQLQVTLHLALETLRVTATILQPIIPNLADSLLSKIGVSKDDRFYRDLEKFSWNDSDFEDKSLSIDNAVLFRRILSEDDQKKKKPIKS